MSTINEEKRSWRERIKDHYRLVVLNDETFQEVSSYRLNLLNLYILASTLVVILGLLVFAIIIYTPIKKVIPGYGDISATPEFIELKAETKALETELIAVQAYIDANKNRLLGNSNTSNTEGIIGQAYAPQAVGQIDTSSSEDKLVQVENTKEIRYFFPPVIGPISSSHDEDDSHFGIDILAEKDAPISAIQKGSVISAEYNIQTGNTISIQHSNNVVSTYKHNSVLLKKVGDIVQTGEAIAIVGNSGTHTDGAHLHFELWIDGRSVNPKNYINFSN